uniref:Uncharacterized protein n=1 Tax=Aegilops tauschii subsp. strangulata TaxID=200361 RepID=A0A453E4V4_AEGTS
MYKSRMFYSCAVLPLLPSRYINTVFFAELCANRKIISEVHKNSVFDRVPERPLIFGQARSSSAHGTDFATSACNG